MRNAAKALGTLVAILALCAPLILWPGEDPQSSLARSSGVTLTIPATVVVPTTLASAQTTTTTTQRTPEPPPTTTTTTAPLEVTVAVAGDVIADRQVLSSVRNEETGAHDFGPVFAPMARYLARADYTVACLEPRLAGPGYGYDDENLLNAPRELAFALRQAGVDMVATANRHSLDFGVEGVIGTLDRLESAGLAHTGTYRSSSERAVPRVIDVHGIRVAFLNYTDRVDRAISQPETPSEPDSTSEGASLPETQVTSQPEDQGTPPAEVQMTSSPQGTASYVGLIDLDAVRQDVKMARLYGADAVIVILNYGEPLGTGPTDEQTILTRQILSFGVDAIVGTRPAVQTIAHIVTYSSWKITEKFVAYSVGDLVSSGGKDNPGHGFVLYLKLKKEGLRTFLTGVNYLPVYIQASTTEEKRLLFRVLPVTPGIEPSSDVPLTPDDRLRMTQLWEDLRQLLYRPDENIVPLVAGF